MWQEGVHGMGGMHGGGHAWQGCVHGRGHAWSGGMHGMGACVTRGSSCMAGGCVWQLLRDTVNERAVRNLLECILVF